MLTGVLSTSRVNTPGRESHEGEEAGEAQAPDGVHSQGYSPRGWQQRRGSLRGDATRQRPAVLRGAPLRSAAKRQCAQVRHEDAADPGAVARGGTAPAALAALLPIPLPGLIFLCISIS